MYIAARVPVFFFWNKETSFGALEAHQQGEARKYEADTCESAGSSLLNFYRT